MLSLLAELGLATGAHAGADFAVGIDIEAVDRWERPATALFTAAEHAHCRAMGHPAESYAGRWCAKEAVLKALAPYLKVSPRDVEIRTGPDGRPQPCLTAPHATGWYGQLRVSIAHTPTVAIALAVAVPSARPVGR
jgi:holo-[acyl-carrier protein] synthase